MTTSPLSLTELYLLWCATLVIALAGLGAAVYAAWNSRRTRRLVLAMLKWAKGVDPLIGRPPVPPATKPSLAVVDADLRRVLDEEKPRPSPVPRPKPDPAEEAWRERFGLMSPGSETSS